MPYLTKELFTVFTATPTIRHLLHLLHIVTVFVAISWSNYNWSEVEGVSDSSAYPSYLCDDASHIIASAASEADTKIYAAGEGTTRGDGFSRAVGNTNNICKVSRTF